MDLDDELQMLQRELMAVQQEKTNPLSERTVAEIMVKLYHSGFAFIPTTDGNEYITPDKLDEEIANLIKQRGKIGLSILPQLLNVGPDIIEARLNPIIQKYSVTRHGSNLFSQRYFDGMIAGLAQRLQQEGRVDLELVAVDNEMKLQFLSKIIASNLHKIHAELSGNQLITKQYTLLKKAKILGFLSAINNPLQIDVLYKAIASEAKSAQNLMLELIAEGKVRGKFMNGYYVPDRFTANQKKVINQLLDSNGYIDLEMLQKKLLVARPQEWISKNLGDNFIKIERVYFKESKLESLAAQVNSLLKTQGFLQLSHVLPISFGEKSLHEFLEERCGLKDYFLCEDFCYSNDWLERLAGQFKQKIIHSIFFKKPEAKGKDTKKKGKKQKTQLVNEQELQEVLFNGGYADYSGAQTLAPELLPLLVQRLEDLKKKTQKELAQSKGLITTAFLKYKSCKTIFRTQQSLARTVNIIQKQLKKTEKWTDADFGPNETDPSGQYSILYYDNIVPKGWPTLQNLKWQQLKPSQLLSLDKQAQNKNFPMRKCHFVTLLQLIQLNNQRGKNKIDTPQIQPLTEESSLPFVYRFFINEKEKRWVLVDNLLPFVQGNSFATLGRYALAQKAYAKLRYCYKGIAHVGIQQMLMEITGRNNIKYSGDTEKQRQLLHEKVQHHLKNQDFVLLMAEGELDKNIIIEDKQSELFALQPYYVYGNVEAIQFQPSGVTLPLKLALELFRNVLVIQRLAQ